MNAQDSAELLAQIDALLGERPQPRWEEILRKILVQLDCALGTIHVVDGRDGLLHLRTHHDLPPPVLEKVRTVPVGKGMAGIAAERRQPVQVCNLQQDQAVVRPGAKLTKAEGSIACPMLSGDEVVGVLGVAKRVPYDFTEQETDLLMEIGRRLAREIKGRK